MPEITFWSLERMKSLPNRSVDVTKWPTGFNGSLCVRIWFSQFFLLLRGFFGGFYKSFIFPVFLPLDREDFLGLVRKFLS